MVRSASIAVATLLAYAPAAWAQPDAPVFHKGERVLIAPYAGEWEYCTLLSDRVGTPPANFSYSALCDRWSGGASGHWIKETHLFSAERVHALNDPDALAGEAQLQAQFPEDHYGVDPEAVGQPAAPPEAQNAPPTPPQAPPPPPPTYPRPTHAETVAGPNFRLPGECTPGRRVINDMNQAGTVLRIAQGTLCVVHLDDGGGDSDGNQSSLFWMLRPLK